MTQGGGGSEVASRSTPIPSRLLAGLAIGLLLLVGASAPNAALPDLSPSGWAPGQWLPLTLGPAAVTGTLWTAYLVGGLAVLLGVRSRAPALASWRLPGVVGALALLTAPFGSADHVNYLAYGRILVLGGNPWTDSPIDFAGGLDPVTSRVEEPWTTEPSVYGPFGTALQGLASWVGGDNLRQGVWVWQGLVVLAWLAVRWLLRAALGPVAHSRVDVLWTLNPLVLGVGVLGGHIDVIATALAVAAVWAATRRAGWRAWVLAGAFVGLAGSTKFTYAVVGLGLAAAAAGTAGTRSRRWLALAGGFLAVVAPLHLWAGGHVYDQLLRSRAAVSLATPWRPLLEWGREQIGNGAVRALISVGAALLAVLLAWCFLRLTRPIIDSPDGTGVAASGLRYTGCLAAAYALAAPYALPWYDLLAWAALPAMAASVLDVILLARLTVISLAYVPGRVLGMTAGVEELTLGVRRGLGPVVALVLWGVSVGFAVRRGSAPRTGPRRQGSGPPPTR